MSDIPLQIGTVLYLNKQETYIPHHYVIVNINPLLLLMITHNIDRVTKLRQNTCPYQTLVKIGPVQYDVLYEDSIIDCNDIDDSRTIEKITKLLKDKQLERKKPLDIKLIKNIYDGILASPVVTQITKEIIKTNLATF